MSVGNTIGTAAALVGVGLAGVVGWKVLEAARAANALNNAASDIRAAGGDPSALDNLIASLRSSGVFSPGREGAVISTGTNQETQFQSDAVLLAAERAMLAAGTAMGLSPNLAVVRPKDVRSNWLLGEGAWLPSQGAAAGWRVTPTVNLRGLDMNAYALVFLPEVYGASADGATIVAYDKRYGVTRFKAVEHNQQREYKGLPGATGPGRANAYDIMITSTDVQGGLVALWDPRRSRFLTAAEGADVIFTINVAEVRDTDTTSKGWVSLASSYAPNLRAAMERKVIFQPFPPAVRAMQQARRDWIGARLRAKAGA